MDTLLTESMVVASLSFLVLSEFLRNCGEYRQDGAQLEILGYHDGGSAGAGW